MKKILALVLVTIMVLSLCGTAFAAKSKTVYVTASGKVYHEKECPNTWNGRYTTTIEEAHKLKLTPCKDCCPPDYDEDDEESNSYYIFVLMGDTEYHCADCKKLWGDEWPGTEMTLKTAQNKELRPCGLCKPDENLNQKDHVYQISETGSYHTCECSTIWRSRFKTTLSALPEGTAPCKYCHPEE